MSARPAVLVIAGSDSSGGAGLARDVEAVEAFGADVLPVVTAVTAQSDRRVLAVHPVPPAIVRAQIEAAFETRIPDAIKIGMLTNRETVEAIAEALRHVAGQNIGDVGPDPAIPIVLDPVLVSSSGGALLDEGGRHALKGRLLPLTTLLTPNVPEAAALLGEAPAASAAALDQLAQRLLELGPRCVLLKGGHASEAEAVDRLACRGESLLRITAPRIRASRRGTGCALASAIAAQLGAGVPLVIACERAQAYIGERLRAAAEAGR
ncbi:MAG TPA: hydroxymethylpyrimidine/phosphomethylpyrimidine kinase [Steroidobacteraceae bacterium]|jgi:hydroxymethylpyrimidine/phosphomethylpyrimidine kinase